MASINAQLELEEMRELEVTQALCFFSFKYKWVLYECTVFRQWHGYG
jgi:hypothetical protein